MALARGSPRWWCELRAADHQRHHIKCDVNYSKRFALFDRCVLDRWL